MRGEKYKELANAQQTRDIPIPAKRGIIYDRNGKELAISISSSTVWVKPKEIENAKETAAKLANILQLPFDKLEKDISNSKYGLVRIARWIEDDVAAAIRKENLKGVLIAEDNKRFFPYGNFATYILGHTTDDNRGAYGIEREYEKYLSGLPGRWIKSTDSAGRQLDSSVEKYYPPENGLSVVLTTDEVIQHFAEKAVQNALEVNKAKRVTAIVMDVKTGDILAMAAKPDYDPNQPRLPLDEEMQLQMEAMSDEEKLDTWFSMWRNPIVNDTYEPGSTFKLITTAVVLEEGIATPDSHFFSPGTISVGGRTLKCWRYYNPHGDQTLTQAVQNSCNVVFVQLGEKLGKDTFYSYLDAFGFNSTTGIDLPGERKSIMYSLPQVGPVELATMSFGQSISITPIQLISAVSAIVNDGILMKPRIVKELVDNEGNVVHRFEEQMVRQVISEKTSQEMREIMQSVIVEGSGKAAYIPGYAVGGKTGTAQKVIDGKYADGYYVSSFIGVAPMDDPKLAVLIIVDEPNGLSHFGSITAAPVAKEILEESLRYLEVKPKYTEEEAQQLVKAEITIPEVRQMTVTEGTKTLKDHKLQYEIEAQQEMGPNTIIVDMFPKPGARVPENSSVMLYAREKGEVGKVLVPDLTGKTIGDANKLLNALGLRLKITGNGVATSQYPEANSEVPLGTIISVEFKPN
ncbi:PASTA domain-containing penicillin-binding protein [Alkaliphilus serpentinus]|uniref:PASTA domain-containing penicillin-binding protein n=1 Tax=Alkaliphilus serpentinus TaxID=1482731 RepID=UPI002431423B|nr:PASTA domain-containing penicillin-binding protein [Alkaliphilus serpentinus]